MYFKQTHYIALLDRGCWRDLYYRGKGETPENCGQNEEYYQDGICLPKCQEGYDAKGLYCESPSDLYDRYFRGPGRVADCQPSQEFVQARKNNNTDLSFGKCFEKCTVGYEGLYSYCVSFKCPNSLHYPCGPVCLPSPYQCTKEIFQVVQSGVHVLYEVVSGKLGDAKEDVKKVVAHLLNWPVCRKVFEQDEFSEGQTDLSALWEWDEGVKPKY